MSDYIKREDVLAKSQTMHDFSWATGCGILNEITAVPTREIEAIPAADVRPVVHGKWVDKGYRYRCSICGKYELYCDAVIYKFCPFCGAEMKKE